LSDAAENLIEHEERQADDRYGKNQNSKRRKISPYKSSADPDKNSRVVVDYTGDG
jgi:hypothetical protein